MIIYLTFTTINWGRCNYSHFTKEETEFQDGTVLVAQLMVKYPHLSTTLQHTSAHYNFHGQRNVIFLLILSHSLFQKIFIEHLLWVRCPRGFNYIPLPVPWFQKATKKLSIRFFQNDFQRKFTIQLKTRLRLNTLKTPLISFGHKHYYLYLIYVFCQTWTWKALN